MRSTIATIIAAAVVGGLFAGSAEAVTVTGGNPLINRPNHDSASGSIFTMLDPTPDDGQLTTWGFFSNDTAAGRLITPLLLEAAEGGVVVRGIGTTRTATNAGIQSYAFGLVSGTDQLSTNYFFAWKDGGNGTNNAGVPEWTNGGDDFGVQWENTETSFSVGQNLGTGSGVLNRIYSVDFTIENSSGWGVSNQSFELPDAATVGAAPGAWQFNGVGGVGVADEALNLGFNPAADGAQWAFVNNSGALSQQIGFGTLDKFLNIGLSFTQLEQSNISNNGSGLRVAIYDGNPLSGGTLLDFIDLAATGSGIQAFQQINLNTGASATVGGNLYLRFQAIDDPGTAGAQTSNVAFDNVVLTIPEPASLSLLALGCLTFLRRRRY